MAANAPNGLMIFATIDATPLMVQSAITPRPSSGPLGNHVAAEPVFRHDPIDLLYVPLRILAHADSRDEAVFSLDQPSTVLAGLGLDAIATVGHQLDDKVAALLTVIGVDAQASFVPRDMARVQHGTGVTRHGEPVVVTPFHKPNGARAAVLVRGARWLGGADLAQPGVSVPGCSAGPAIGQWAHSSTSGRTFTAVTAEGMGCRSRPAGPLSAAGLPRSGWRSGARRRTCLGRRIRRR